MTPPLLEFCLRHEEALLIPAESLGPRGIDAELRSALSAADRLSEAQLDCLDAGFRLYWERCNELFAKAPAAWFPPRPTNLLICSDELAVVPYFEPFVRTSSLLYHSDLGTHPEYIAFLLLHMERLSLLHQVRPTFVLNLSYWLLREAGEIDAFCRAARRARRPDAKAFVALGEALLWLRNCYHNPLRAPTEAAHEPYVEVSGADLYVPKRRQEDLFRLCEDFERAIHTALQAHAAPARKPTGRSAPALDAFCTWLQEERAHLIINGADGRELWDPTRDDSSAVRAELAGASDEVVRSLHEDCRVVHERTKRFFSAVRSLETLPRQCSVLETGGGAYVDAARQAVVYELKQPGFDSLGIPAPPFHRLLLGARVMHEWGHLAHAGKYLRVPEHRRDEYQAARERLGDRFHRVLERVPMRLRDGVDAELRELSRAPSERPRLLARKTMARVGDYLANLMSSHLIPGDEMQAYVRNNVRHYLDENLGIVSQLARYAYEVHYLALAGMQRGYFYDTSRFSAYFIDSGIVSREDADGLFDAAGEVLACWEIDASKLAIAPATT